MAEGVIAHEDVLRHVYAFLQAYGYSSALLALQNESRVPYNTIPVAADESGDGSAAERPTSAGLAAAVRSGAWDTVLSVYVDGLLLPDEVAFDLYECIVEELLVLRGFAHAARALFANSPVFASMRRTSAVRYARVQQMLDTHLTTGQAERGEMSPLPPALQQRREALLSVLQEAITFDAEPYDGALPAALWQYLHGISNGTGEAEARTRNDSIQTKRPRTETTEAPSPGLFIHYPLQCPKNIRGKFAFADAELPVACTSTMLERAEDGCSYAALIVGKTDGSIDFLDASAAAPVGPSVGHTDGVLSIALDAAGEGAVAVVWLAAGYRDGWVKVYNTQSRKLVRRFADVHTSGVTSVVFAGARSPALFGHSAWVVSGSFDGAIHVLDIHEGRALQQLRGAHQGKYVLSLCAVPGGVVSAGNNGALCFWAAASAGLEPAGPARMLHDVCAPCRGDVPTRLLPVAAARGADGGGEFVVLTRGRRVLVLAARFTGGAAAAAAVALRTSLVAPRPVHSGCLRVTRSPALSAPVLSLFLTDNEGTVLLYSIEMVWRAAGDSTGSRVELRPADETAVVVAECGRAVEDLCLVDVPEQRATLLAYSPSLPAMYVLCSSG